MIALREIAWAHTSGRIRLVAAAVNTTLAHGAPCMDTLLRTDGITVPIGVPLTSHVPSGTPPYQTDIRSRGISSGVITGSETYSDAVTVFRTALAAAAGQVDILELGYMTNLMELLQSPADGISALTGLELITAKVRRLWVMGGDYLTGNENNFTRTAQAITAARTVVGQWPTPITYIGYSVGLTVITGDNLVGQQATDLVADALYLHGTGVTGRASWDGMAALAAIAPSVTAAGYTWVRGKNAVDALGANTFTANVNGRDMYLVKSSSDADFKTIINTLLVKSNWGSYLPF